MKCSEGGSEPDLLNAMSVKDQTVTTDNNRIIHQKLLSNPNDIPKSPKKSPTKDKI